MKSIKEHFNSRKLFMFLALVFYCVAVFFLQVCFIVTRGYVTLFAVISVALIFAVLCSIYAHKSKDFLYCPKCGSKKIVRTTLFGIPEILYDECPECHEKIDVNKPVNKD